MSPDALAQVRALLRCRFAPGSTPKRFVKLMSLKAAQDPACIISAKAAAFLNRLGHSYRRQIGRCMAVDCEKCHPAPKQALLFDRSSLTSILPGQ